jgi:hypothetical protein
MVDHKPRTADTGTLQCTLGEVDFWIFRIFNVQQLNLDWQRNSKTKVEKAFFLFSMSSCPEMSFLGPKKRKIH